MEESMSTGSTQQDPGRPREVVEAVELSPDEQIQSTAGTSSRRGAANDNNLRTPTLRRVALLNTLVFLGLALSHSEINAHQADSVPSTTNAHRQPKSSDLDEHHPRQTDVFRTSAGDSSKDQIIDPAETYQQLQNLFGEDEQQTLVEDEEEEVFSQGGQDVFEEIPQEEASASSQNDVIIVAAVDGTIAAIDISNGKVLWKQVGEGSKESKDDNHDGMKFPHLKESTDGKGGQDKLLQPLIATTTTAKSSRQTATSDSTKTAAIPSIDGSVYLTTTGQSKDGGTRPTDPSSMTTTITSSLRELVNRAPYVDSNGRFFVGSRHATAAAIDGDTGEILYIASADGDNEESNTNNNSDPQWEGRNIVWLGRVDYSVSIYNARTSSREVQFSAAEIMSVNDMVAGHGKMSSKIHYHHHYPYQEALSTTSERAPNLMLSHDEQVFENPIFTDAPLSAHHFSELVSTPSGNLAFRNPSTGQLEWVADQIFETPIAYAIRSSTGDSLNIDIIPDVTMPSQSKEYLAKEIERQIEITLNDDDDDRSNSNTHVSRHPPSVVGTLLSGQLYAMPLGKRRHALPSSSLSSASESAWTDNHHSALGVAGVHQHHSVASSSSSAPISSKHTGSKKSPVGSVNRISNLQDEQRHLVGGLPNKICSPSSQTFPGCLFKAVSQFGTDQVHGIDAPPDKRHIQSLHHDMDASAVGEYMAQYSYAHQYAHQHVYDQKQQRQRNYRKILRILGSWLPPTIALIFVVSFELGRRKRQKDAQEELNDNNVLDFNDLIRPTDEKGNITYGGDSRQVIQITDQVLGYGGHGTVVFRGTLEGRNVAVKRMLKTYLASADREISLMIESDGHPNVTRYFLKEVKGDFVYLALELCDLSLHNLIGTLVNIRQDSGGDDDDKKSADHDISLATKKLILQITNGVKHLHSLRIVHNDLKPANILLAMSKEAKSPEGDVTNETIHQIFKQGQYVAKISDMGLGKMLAGQSSFGGTHGDVSNRAQSSAGNSHSRVGIGPGTVGWMAPEAMRVKSITTLSTDNSTISNSAEASPIDRSSATVSRASRSVDIFSLGCIFYSTLVPGSHPFGEWYEREANIMHNQPNIEALKKMSVEAHDLVSAMIQHNPRNRPSAKQICEHPFFWSLQQKLSFVCDLSDRLETDSLCLNDPEPDASSFASHPLAIESNASQVVGLAWDKVLYKDLIHNVQRYRAYDPCSVRDLLRLIRNKHHHYDELPADVRQRIGTNTEGLMSYFESCFPGLLLHCYKVCREILSPDDPLVKKYSITTIDKRDNGMKVALTPIIPERTNNEHKPLPLLSEEATPVAPPNKTAEDRDECQGKVTVSSMEKNAADENSSNEVNDTKTPDLNLEGTSVKTAESEEEVSTSRPDNSILQSPLDLSHQPIVEDNIQNDIVLWEGSTAARAFNCRGWIRSDDEWTRRTVGSKKRNANLVRCGEDPKFRTRLCNHWDTTLGTSCPMRKKNKCVFAHGPVELRVKDGKRHRWGKLVDKNGNNSNPKHSGGEDTYGAARSIESARKEEGKWNTDPNNKTAGRTKKQATGKKKTKVSRDATSDAATTES